MVPIYKKKIGRWSYNNYSDDDLAKVVDEVRNGKMSYKAATEKYSVRRTGSSDVLI